MAGLAHVPFSTLAVGAAGDVLGNGGPVAFAVFLDGGFEESVFLGRPLVVADGGVEAIEPFLAALGAGPVGHVDGDLVPEADLGDGDDVGRGRRGRAGRRDTRRRGDEESQSHPPQTRRRARGLALAARFVGTALSRVWFGLFGSRVTYAAMTRTSLRSSKGNHLPLTFFCFFTSLRKRSRHCLGVLPGRRERALSGSLSKRGVFESPSLRVDAVPLGDDSGVRQGSVSEVDPR